MMGRETHAVSVGIADVEGLRRFIVDGYTCLGEAGAPRLEIVNGQREHMGGA
jgi:hypothetical protein